MWHHWNMMQFLLAFPLAKFVNGSEMFPRGHRTQLLVRALCGNLNTYIIYYAVREGEKKAEFRFKKTHQGKIDLHVSFFIFLLLY